MAVEVQFHRYRFGVQPPIQFSSKPVAKPQFLHNYLHDVEGLWWIMMYSLFSTRPALEAAPSPDDLKKRIAARNALFPLSLTESAVREHFMSNQAVKEKYLLTLPKSYLPLAQDMTNACWELVDQYANVRAMNFNHDSFKDVYSKLRPFFEGAKVSGVEDVLPLEELNRNAPTDGQPPASETSSASRKRSRATSRTNDDDDYVNDLEPVSKTRKTRENGSKMNVSTSSHAPRRSTRLAKTS